MLNLTLLNSTPLAGLRQSFFCQADFGGLTVSSFLAHTTLVVVLVASLLKIYFMTRRAPKIEDHYATKAELKTGLEGVREAGEKRRNEIKEELADMSRGFSTQLNNMESTMGRNLQEQNSMLMSIQRTLGRLEGHQDHPG